MLLLRLLWIGTQKYSLSSCRHMRMPMKSFARGRRSCVLTEPPLLRGASAQVSASTNLANWGVFMLMGKRRYVITERLLVSIISICFKSRTGTMS